MNCYLLKVPRLPSQLASSRRCWVIDLIWLELPWQYIAMTRNNLSTILISIIWICPKTKSATHCHTKIFPIYQNKHWIIRVQHNCSINPWSNSSMLKIVGFLVIQLYLPGNSASTNSIRELQMSDPTLEETNKQLNLRYYHVSTLGRWIPILNGL